MPFSDLDPLPSAPQRTDTPDDFILKADAWVAQMETFSNQLNTFIGELELAAALIAAAPAYADPGLVAMTGKTPAADRGIYFTSGVASALFTLTAAGRALIDDADASAQRTTLGLGALAVLATINGSLWSGADLAVVDGGTGASSASAARSNLGLGTAATADASQLVPAGAVQPFAMSAAPTGWLKCDGSSVLRATYADLFTAIGTTFGSADGTHFTLPDLRGEFVRGYDDGKGTDSGRVFGSAQAEDLLAHTHSITVRANSGTGAHIEDADATGGSASTELTGSTGGTETRPRNIALLYCIKT